MSDEAGGVVHRDGRDGRRLLCLLGSGFESTGEPTGLQPIEPHLFELCRTLRIVAQVLASRGSGDRSDRVASPWSKDSDRARRGHGGCNNPPPLPPPEGTPRAGQPAAPVASGGPRDGAGANTGGGRRQTGNG